MEDKSKNVQHPIQLVDLKVLELSLKVKLENAQDRMPDSGVFGMHHGHTEYDAENKRIVVKVGVDMSEENDDETPFEMKVELLGVFLVDESRFPVKFIEDWAAKNAPLILYPYIREQVHSLTTRAGFSGVILPLFEVPTFKLQK